MRGWIFTVFFLCFLSNKVCTQTKTQDPYVLMDTIRAQIAREQDEDKKVWLTTRLAISYKSVGQFNEGLKIATAAVEMAKKINSKHYASALNMAALLNKDLGNYDLAIKTFEEVIAIVEKNKDLNGIASTNVNIANIESTRGNLQKALKRYNLALEAYRKMNAKVGIGIVLNNIGITEMELGNYPAALKNLSESYQIFSEAKYPGGKGASGKEIGDIYFKQGYYAEASRYFFMALKDYEEAKDDHGRSITMLSLGILYQKSNFDEAMKYYENAMELAVKTGSKQTQSEILLNIGGLQIARNDNEKALQTFREALKLNEEIDNKHSIATALNNIGLIYKTKNNYLDALKNLQASEKISVEIGEQLEIADVHNSIASLYTAWGKSLQAASAKEKFKQALDYYTKALAEAKLIGAKDIQKNSYAGLSELYETQKNYQAAYVNHQRFTALNDSLQNNENTKKMETIRIQYEIEKAKTEESVKQEKIKAEMQLAFVKKEDSLKFKQNLTALELIQQTLVAKQREQDLKLKEQALDLLNKKHQITTLAFQKSNAELEAEQSKSLQKEKELTIANQVKELQSNDLKLKNAEISLKQNELDAQKRQRYYYLAGLLFLLIVSGLVYLNVRNKQKAATLVTAEKLKAEKANAAHKMVELELQSLRAQLNPHFMFNSLNAIQELILKEDSDNSHLYLSRFSELLRMLLDNANEPFIPLGRELHLADLYLSLEKLRVPNLKYTIDIKDNIDLDAVSIPNMILQPYIENAIWHGLVNKSGERSLKIQVSRNRGELLVNIEDNGIGRKKADELKTLNKKAHKSKGMELLSKRFQLLSKEYGSEIRTTITDIGDYGDASGTRVSIQFPQSVTSQNEEVFA